MNIFFKHIFCLNVSFSCIYFRYMFSQTYAIFCKIVFFYVVIDTKSFCQEINRSIEYPLQPYLCPASYWTIMTSKYSVQPDLSLSISNESLLLFGDLNHWLEGVSVSFCGPAPLLKYQAVNGQQSGCYCLLVTTAT